MFTTERFLRTLGGFWGIITQIEQSVFKQSKLCHFHSNDHCWHKQSLHNICQLVGIQGDKFCQTNQRYLHSLRPLVLSSQQMIFHKVDSCPTLTSESTELCHKVNNLPYLTDNVILKQQSPILIADYNQILTVNFVQLQESRGVDLMCSQLL